MDSAQMRSRAATRTRPTGLFLAPVASDSLVLAAETDSFQITLVSRDCAASSNEVAVLSPEDSLLSATMCQQTVPTTWSFEGPYPDGTGIGRNSTPHRRPNVWRDTSRWDPAARTH
jgi:hypothetical protein